jgi:hypothetical protein
MDIEPMRWAADPGFPRQREAVEYLPALRAAQRDPAQIEELYRQARREHQLASFSAAVLTCYQEAPDNLLYGAWYYRLHTSTQDERPAPLWRIAVPLSLLTGLIFWALSNPQFMLNDDLPYLVLLWSPIAAALTLGFLAWATRQHIWRAAALAGSILAVSAYVVLMGRRTGFAGQESYLELMIPHLPLLACSAIGVFLVGLRSQTHQRFAFLTKLIEVIGSGGVYAVGVVIFALITQGLFEALGVELSEAVTRLLFVGGLGALPLLAVATVYDPRRSPADQDFRRGLGKTIAIVMWLLLPLTLIVLIAYLGLIPFHFLAPFRDRDVLIVYNVMLFAIMGLFVGATPITTDELPVSQQRALRMVMLAVACLAVLVSLYAMAALIFRTLEGGLTVNRVAMIGWNTLNLGVLGALIGGQLRRGPVRWIESLQAVFGKATVWYAAWAALLAITIPWFF